MAARMAARCQWKRSAVLMTALAWAPLGAVAPADAQDAAVSAAAVQAAESWTGEVELPGGALLEFALSITRGEEPAATIDIPSQGAIAMPIEVVRIEGDEYELRLPAPANADIVGRINDAGELTGVLKQAGMEFPFTMTRQAEAEAGPARPQHPEAPFPYLSEDFSFRNDFAGIELAGTLTIPEGSGPFPAAVLVSGSGPQDRDETLVGHKPFWVIADHLTRRGIAVLRYDDRGTAASGGDFASATTDDFAADALAALHALQADTRIDPLRIGIIGHSEGGIVAPIAAAQDHGVAYAVLLAGTGVNGGEVIRSQQVAMAQASGAPDEAVRALDTGLREIVSAVRTADRVTIEENLRRALVYQNPGMDDATLEQVLAGQVGFFSSGWMRRFVEIDPADVLRRMNIPVLAVSGSLDLQVLPEINVEPMRRALESAPTDDVTILVYPELNHLFQEAQTGLMSEYATIEETFSPRVLEMMSDWIAQRFLD